MSIESDRAHQVSRGHAFLSFSDRTRTTSASLFPASTSSRRRGSTSARSSGKSKSRAESDCTHLADEINRRRGSLSRGSEGNRASGGGGGSALASPRAVRSGLSASRQPRRSRRIDSPVAPAGRSPRSLGDSRRAAPRVGRLISIRGWVQQIDRRRGEDGPQGDAESRADGGGERSGIVNVTIERGSSPINRGPRGGRPQGQIDAGIRHRSRLCDREEYRDPCARGNSSRIGRTFPEQTLPTFHWPCSVAKGHEVAVCLSASSRGNFLGEEGGQTPAGSFVELRRRPRIGKVARAKTVLQSGT